MSASRPAPAVPRPIDPLRPSRSGHYEDDAVVVVRRPALRVADGETWVGRTAHFGVGRDHGRLLVVHALDAATVDNDLAVLLAAELFTPGWAAGAHTFERLFTGVVLSCSDDPAAAWEAFYRNTLRRLDEAVVEGEDGPVAPVGPTGEPLHGSVAEFAGVYRHAEALTARAGATSLLDLGSCFGFLPLRVAAGRAGDVPDVVACDVSDGTTRLLAAVSARLGTPVRALTCDAAAVPVPDRSVDVVTALHLLEHVDTAHADRIVDEALRAARHRVVVAVPLEDEPEAAFGHVRTVDLDDLRALGERCANDGWRYGVEERHGGWLVLDRA